MEVHEPPATYAQYRLLPEEAPRYEIIGGVGTLAPAPGTGHQIVIGNLYALLREHAQAEELGRVYLAPLDVVLSETDVVQPDLIFISASRLSIVREEGVFGAPDLAVEVLSPSTARRDLGQKLSLYSRYGVREYWAVDPVGRTVDLWTSAETALDTRRVVTGDGMVASKILAGLEIPLGRVFAGVPGEGAAPKG